MGIDQAIIDFTAGVLLRYFRGGAPIGGVAPRLDHRRDVDLLKAHWSVSAPVRDLVGYVLTNPHEAQSLFRFETRVNDAVARGRIDARRTLQYRLQSGLSSAIVAEEPVRSFDTGPNLVLAWVLREAGAYTARLASWQGDASPYRIVVEEAQRDLRAVQRLEALRDPLRAIALGRKPAPGAVQVAARSRQPIYQLAVYAYRLLQGIERGEPASIDRIARSALIGPIDDWRRFELAVGLAAGEAIAGAGAGPLRLHLLGGASSGPIITTGRFDLYWQQRTSFYNAPPLEPSETAVRDILAAYGMSVSGDRPDFIVVDREAAEVAAVIEVKYLAGDTAGARFREAVDQVVRYARGYRTPGSEPNLISRSLIALSRGAPPLIEAGAIAPASIDFAGIEAAKLASWADRLVGAPPPL